MRRKIILPNKLTVDVFGLLTGDEYQLGSRRDDNLRVYLWNWQISRVDEFERHYKISYVDRLKSTLIITASLAAGKASAPVRAAISGIVSHFVRV